MRFVCESCRAQYMINDEKVGPKGVKVRCRKCGYVILVKKTDGLGAAPAADGGDANATQVLENPLMKPAATSTEAGKTQAEDHTSLGGVDDVEEKTRVGGVVPNWIKSDGKDSFLGAGEDEIGAVFDQVLSTGPNAIPKVVSEGEAAAPKTNGHANSGDDLYGDEDSGRDSTRVIDVDVVRKLAEQSGDAPAKKEEGEPAAEEVPSTDWYVAINEKQTGPLTLETVKQHWDHGEVGPDSLCWRAGFADWVPVSSVKTLASVLAPRPSKPIVVVPAAVEPPQAIVNVPVQSAFSAGGMVQTMQSSMQVPLGMPSAAMGAREETGTWKPSAASALASLVQDEMAALAKPAARENFAPVPSSPGAVPGLLDLPSDEDRAPAPVAEAPRVAAVPQAPVNPYLANPGATYSAPALTQYRPPNNRNMIIAIGAIAATVVLVLVALIIWVVTRQPQQVIVQAPTPPVAVAVVPPAPVAANPTPVAVVPAPVAVAPAPGTTAPAPGTTAPAPGTTAPAPGTTAPVAVAPVQQPAEPVKVARRDPVVRTATQPARAAKEPAPAPAPVEEKRPAASPGSAEDDFEKSFGIEKGSKKAAPEPEKKKTAVYIPPAPGGGGDMKDSLGQSDIMEVVLSNKPALAKCVADQKSKDPGTSGKLLMRWTIQTSGKTSNIGVASDEFKGTYIAGCIGGLIKGWAFPRHKTQGEPVTFPFKF